MSQPPSSASRQFQQQLRLEHLHNPGAQPDSWDVQPCGPSARTPRSPRTESVLLPLSLCRPGQAGREGTGGPQDPGSGHNVLVQWKDLTLRDKDMAVKDEAANPLVPRRADPRCVIGSS